MKPRIQLRHLPSPHVHRILLDTKRSQTKRSDVEMETGTSSEPRALASLAQVLDETTWKDGPEGRLVEVDAWITVAQAVVRVFRRFGMAFAPAQADIENNVAKIQAFRGNHRHVEELLLHEKEEGISKQDPSATIAILWTRRAFHFLLVALEDFLPSAQDRQGNVDDVALGKALSHSYECTLKKYHGMVLYAVFKSSIALAPSTKKFFQKLGYQDLDRDTRVHEDILHDLETCIHGLRALVEHTMDFYQRHGIENDAVV